MSGAGFLSPEVRRDPHAYYAALRRDGPVAWDDATRSWYVVAHAAVAGLLRDPSLSARTGEVLAPDGVARHHAATLARVEGFFNSWMVFSDPPRHSRMRLQFAAEYAPRAATVEWRRVAAAAATRLLGGLRPARADLLHGFAEPLATDVVCAVLGITDGDRPAIVAWSKAIMAYLATPQVEAERLNAADDAIARLRSYVSDGMGRTAAPGAPAHLRALTAVPLDDAVAFFAQVLTGGIEPVCSCLGSMIVELLRPEQRLLDDVASGAVDPAAIVEEALRFDAPFHFVTRTTRAPLPLAGTLIPSGSRLKLVLAAANRDPSVYAAPDAFRIRRGEPPHLAFGAGNHFCLGAAVARVILQEAAIALAHWSARGAVRRVAARREESYGSTRWQHIHQVS